MSRSPHVLRRRRHIVRRRDERRRQCKIAADKFVKALARHSGALEGMFTESLFPGLLRR